MRTRLPLPGGWNRRVESSILQGRWDSYPAGTTFAGELPPVAHVDQCTRRLECRVNRWVRRKSLVRRSTVFTEV